MENQKSRFIGMVPAKIIDALKSRKCILFAGSGLSAQVSRSDGRPLPTWREFLIELLKWAEDEKIRFWGEPRDIEKIIEKNNLLMAAQELQERVGTERIGEFLNSVFGDKSVRPSSTHRILPHIPFRGILTTNYDSLIEGAYTIENEGKIPPIFTQEDLLSRPSPLRRSDFFIFKLHGHFDRPQTVVLGSRDYQNLFFRTPGYRHFLETLFSTHTVIFVGFSAEDPDVNNALDRLSSIYSRTLDNHYILLPSYRMNYTEKRRLAFDRRLEVIEYIEDKNHTQVTEFLQELVVQVKREPKEITPYIGAEPSQLKIFLSGSFKDHAVLVGIAKFLREKGYSPWLAKEKIRPGEVWSQRISAAIQSSDCMIVVFSENSVQSEWVRKEFEFASYRALEDRMRIFPIVIGEVIPPAYLRDIIYLRLNRTFDTEDLEPLSRALKVLEHAKQNLK